MASLTGPARYILKYCLVVCLETTWSSQAIFPQCSTPCVQHWLAKWMLIQGCPFVCVRILGLARYSHADLDVCHLLSHHVTWQKTVLCMQNLGGQRMQEDVVLITFKLAKVSFYVRPSPLSWWSWFSLSELGVNSPGSLSSNYLSNLRCYPGSLHCHGDWSSACLN